MIDQSVGDVMTQPIRTIPAETTACEVATLFAEHEIGSVVVVSESGESLGIVTETDIMQQVAAGADMSAVHAETMMSTPLITITSTEDIHTAAALMKDNSIRRLPVLDDGELIGNLTTTDLTHYLPRLLNRIVRERTDRGED
ncbi:MAG: CBS domain-containing protein [Haloarculaceae archaeon]